MAVFSAAMSTLHCLICALAANFLLLSQLSHSLTVNDIQHKGWKLSLPLIESRQEVEPLFNAYLAAFNKSYSHPQTHLKQLPPHEFISKETLSRLKEKYELRLKIFQESLKRHQALNEYEKHHNGTAVYGINRFSDFTPEEFQAMLPPSKPLSAYLETESEQLKMKESDGVYCFHNDSLPPSESVDWRKGHVTAIKDQMKCGSCWAFTATQQVESYWSIAGHNLEELSVQELISCSSKTGCRGGNTCYVLEWLSLAKYPQGGPKVKLVPASEYPYEDKESPCRYPDIKKIGATISAVCGCHSLVGHEDVMVRWMHQKGPIAISVNALSWHDYVGGIIQHHCSGNILNHAVQMVGYNLSKPVPYWIVKNSWGPAFGEDGYLRIKLGDNLCGLASEPLYIVI